MDIHSIKSKLLLLVLLISSIFISSTFITQAANDKVASDFNLFYKHIFSATMSFENLKSAQTNIMLNIRGLQIAYLLELTEQTDEYVIDIKQSLKETPILMSTLKDIYTGESRELQSLENKIMIFQEKSQNFMNAMASDENNKAPYAVFSAFRDSFTDLEKQFNLLTELNKTAADTSHLEASQAIDKAVWLFYVTIFVALSIATVSAILFSNKMIKNINVVKDVAVELSKGNLTVRGNVHSKDEIEQLNNALNTTITKFNESLSAISKSTLVVTNNSKTLLDSNENIQRASTEVSDNTVQAATAIEELTITSRDIAHNISETARTSEAMATLAQRGIDSSSETKEVVINLVENLNKASDVVSKLQDESTRIESILDVIRGISDQTNLLALNAAIEAARAGEQGRGFAVVADEVRGLAQRSQSSVNEIETMLSQLCSASEHAVKMMGVSIDIATSAEDKVMVSNQAIEDILLMIRNVNEQTQQIATAAEEQSSVSVEISMNMQTVQMLSNEAAKISLDTVAISDEMSQMSQDVNEKVSFFNLR